jgi:quinol monooxygenase YgiN
LLSVDAKLAAVQEKREEVAEASASLVEKIHNEECGLLLLPR